MQDKADKARQEAADSPVAWFAVLERAKLTHDFARAAYAVQELERLGVRVKYQKPKGAAPKRVTRFLKRRREPGEIAMPVVSIRNQCLECCGYQPSEVELCTAPKCWLWPWRFGRTPEGAARQGKDTGVEVQTRRILAKNAGLAPGFPGAEQAAAGGRGEPQGVPDTQEKPADSLESTGLDTSMVTLTGLEPVS
jgi:hypothetical protein